MVRKSLAVVIVTLLLVGLARIVIPVDAAPAAQVYYQTPTANAEGRILYVVKAGDTCLSVSLLTGIDINTLRQLNNLDEQCTLIEGKQLLLGIYQTPTVTPGPAPTNTPVLPTPTPFNGNAQVCVFLYNDVNGNALAETGEAQIPGGAISITDRIGKVSLTSLTGSGSDPICFEEVPEGDYNLSVAPPEGYNPTTNMNFALAVHAGDQLILDFGAQAGSQVATPAPEDSNQSPVLGILGAVLVLGGIGLAVYMLRFRKQ